MRQLVELQKHYEQIQGLNAEVLAVFREENSGEEGLQKSRENTKAAYPLLLIRRQRKPRLTAKAVSTPM